MASTLTPKEAAQLAAGSAKIEPGQTVSQAFFDAWKGLLRKNRPPGKQWSPPVIDCNGDQVTVRQVPAWV